MIVTQAGRGIMAYTRSQDGHTRTVSAGGATPWATWRNEFNEMALGEMTCLFSGKSAFFSAGG